MTKDLYPERIKNAYDSISNNLIKNWVKYLKGNVTKKEIKETNTGKDAQNH